MLKIAYHPIYKHPLPEGHRFPMIKYDLLPQQLLHEGTCENDNFFKPDFPSDEKLLAVHDHTYYNDLVHLNIKPSAARKIGFALSHELVQRERIIADGTIKGCEYALKYG
ncbi:MAG: histone deacetylase, partial [Croceitalea sp.]|nr:histone deacetylase [Croceitalea sp.]